MRTARVDSFFKGDIVYLYDHDVHGEDPCNGAYKFPLGPREHPVDIGIVVDNVENSWWPMVYWWKRAKIETHRVTRIFIVQDEWKRGVSVPASELDEHAPKYLLRGMVKELGFE